MNYNNSKYDFRRKEVLIAKGIEQAWRRRFLHNIHSGVRVKVQRKNSSLIEPNHIQSMLKRLWFESEISDKKSFETIHNSSQIKPIFNNSFLRKNHLLEIKQKDKNMNSIGIQTTMITQIDRETSCNLIKSIPMIIQKNRSSSSSSTTSISETSISDSTSTETSTVSSTTIDTNENIDHHARYRQNKNRNNNAVDTDSGHIDMKEFKMKTAIIQLSNNEQSLQDMKNNTKYDPQMTSSTGKKGFFDTFVNLISSLRLSSFKQDRFTIGTPVVINAGRNETNKNIQLPTSRCRRSATRNFNHNSSIEPKKTYSQIKSEEDSPSNCNQFEQKAFIYSVSDISSSTRKQSRQANNSNLSIVDSHRSKKKSSTTTRRKHSYRKNYTNRHHKRKYLHRKKRKYFHTSNRSSHSQWSSQLNTLSIPSIINENQPLSPVNDRSKVLVEECIKSSVCHMEYPNNICSSNHKQKNNLFLKTVANLFENKQDFSPPTDPIRLYVKNKNLISNLSKSKIPLLL